MYGERDGREGRRRSVRITRSFAPKKELQSTSAEPCNLRRLLQREVQLRKRLDGECAERSTELAPSSATVESVLFL